ncbi:MAG: zinc ribbon domain-containing protein [Balneolaceae bacterium]|nr:zinc ribbon domain-containing protein [Balneolaceae bacterium]
MKKKECPGCAVEVDKSEEVCPICGYDFPKQPLSLKIAVWVFIILTLTWILL